MANENLNQAKINKNDEFYTQKADIESELSHYQAQFKGKTVYLNCDDPTASEFWRYFYRLFGHLELKKLIATHYEQDNLPSYALIYQGGSDSAENFDQGVDRVQLEGNGDFRSDECVKFLKESDIIVTNPPFSLAREYVKQLMQFKKKFLIIGNKNWITYKEIFPLLMHRKMWFGVNSVKEFAQPDGSFKKFGNVGWFTNLPVQKPTDQMIVWKPFNQEDYPAYDNYAAFECRKIADIPSDMEIEAEIDANNLKGWQETYGDDLAVVSENNNEAVVNIKRPIWGVPITFLDKYNPESPVETHNLAKEFDVLGLSSGITWNDINLIDDYKRYENAKQYGKNGKVTNGSKINTRSSIVVKHPTGTYYTADGSNNKYKLPYARIFIRAKESAKF